MNSGQNDTTVEIPTSTGADPLQERLARARAWLKSPPFIPRATSADIPATPLQRQLWFVNELTHTPVLYHRPVVIDFEGRLDIDALIGAIQHVIDRHQIIRQRIVVVDGNLLLKPIENATINVIVDDLSSMSYLPDDVDQMTHQEIEQPFDLRQGPLLRNRILKINNDRHRLICTFHHAIFDGWSEGVLIGELRECYAAIVEKRTPQLGELPIQYTDYATWYQERIARNDYEDERQFWKEALTNAPGLLDLPHDRRYPQRLLTHGASCRFIWEREFVDRLEQFGRLQDATLFMTLMAGFQVLLHRYSNQPDIVVGTYTSGRARVELERLIGLFAGPLPIRVEIQEDRSFQEVLRLAREAILDAFSHQNTPYSQMLLDASPRRNPQTYPLFQCSLQLRNYDGASRDVELFYSGNSLPPLEFRCVDIDSRAADLDLAFDFRPTHEGLHGAVQYSTDLFDRETVERIVRQFYLLLESAIQYPDIPVNHHLLIEEEERKQILIDWNDTTLCWPSIRCIHEHIEEQVQQSPHAVALIFEGLRLSYDDLNQRANRLAHRLIERGVQAETHVAVSLERSPELLISLLAILKAGGAYVPIEPGLPPERIRFLLDDTSTPIVMTRGKPAEVIAKIHPGVVLQDPADPRLDDYPTHNPGLPCSTSQLAYIIYTSGSTGKPKGVLIEHASIVNHLLWFQKEFGFGPGETILQQTSYGFDVSVWELFVPIMCGATEVMARPDGHRDSRYLVELIARESITSVHFVPPMLRYFLSTPGLERCTSLKRITCSGEALPFDLMEQALRQLNVDVYNLYGPTEAAVHITGWRCHADEPRRIVPIGKPLANCRAYILDNAGQLLPVGIPGELHLGGIQVARGYLNRPELTNDKFIDDSFSPYPDNKLYKTGDLTRWLPDGRIEFLGRIDHQIKAHGVRIEAGEIEATLNSLPEVKSSVVISREVITGSNQIVAYIVFEPGQMLAISEIRRELTTRLPAYMMPSYFVELSRIPLTSSGKVDRRALPNPDTSSSSLDISDEGPTTTTEMALTEIWMELLQLEHVGIHDDFFEVGGDSMHAIGLFLEIEKRLNVKLSASMILRGTTISSLAAMIDKTVSQRHKHLVELRAGDGQSPLFILHTLSGQVLYARNIIEYLDHNQCVCGLQQPADFEDLRSIPDLTSLVRRYVDEIRDRQPHGPYRIAGYSFGGQLAYEVARQLRESGEEVSLLAIIDTGVRQPPTDSLSKRLAVIFTVIFWKNLPFWFWEDFAKSSPNAMFFRIRRRMRVIWRHLASMVGIKVTRDPPRRVDDIFTEDEIPAHLRMHMERNLELLNSHEHAKYDGSMVLFESRARPLFQSHQLKPQWASLVTGEISLYRLPGNHGNVLKPPAVEIIAKTLQEKLATIADTNPNGFR